MLVRYRSVPCPAVSCRVLPIIGAENGAVDRGENGIVRAVNRGRKTQQGSKIGAKLPKNKDREAGPKFHLPGNTRWTRHRGLELISKEM